MFVGTLLTDLYMLRLSNIRLRRFLVRNEGGRRASNARGTSAGQLAEPLKKNEQSVLVHRVNKGQERTD